MPKTKVSHALSPTARVFYISLVLSHARRVLTQSNTRLASQLFVKCMFYFLPKNSCNNCTVTALCHSSVALPGCLPDRDTGTVPEVRHPSFPECLNIYHWKDFESTNVQQKLICLNSH